jgi:hypothetical protein
MPSVPRAAASTLVLVETWSPDWKTRSISAYRAFGTGAIERVPFDFPPHGYSALHASEEAVAAPDGVRVAFLRDGKIAVIDTRTLAITNVPVAPAAAGARLLLREWSRDSRELLVWRGPSDDDDPTRERRYRIVDVASGKERDANIPGYFRAWLPDGDYVAELGYALLRGNPRTRGHREVTRFAGTLVQPAISSTGRFGAVGLLEHKGGSINKVDLATGRTTVVINGEQIWNPRPAFSPGDRLAWREAKTGTDNPPSIRVRIEGGATVDAEGRVIANFQWLDDATMILMTDDEMIVKDTASNTEKGRLRLR